jgi:Spy/CpxP family protein refolding chaperone
MKKYRFFASLTLTALLALGTLAWAQDSTPSGGQSNATSGTGTAENDPAENRVRHIADQLNLTPEQRDQIRPIVKQEAEQIQAVRNDNSLTPEQKQAKLREIHQTFRPQIAKVLTPEQKQKFKEMKEEGREHHRGMRGGVPPKDR